MKSTPLEVVKERFGDKGKLVAEVEKLAQGDLWIDRINDEKGLSHASNAKLLRLHARLMTVKEQFGSREKLISAILQLQEREKDGGLKARLEAYPAPRLLDLHAAASRRRKASENKPKVASPEKKRRARSRKAQAKARAS